MLALNAGEKRSAVAALRRLRLAAPACAAAPGAVQGGPGLLSPQERQRGKHLLRPRQREQSAASLPLKLFIRQPFTESDAGQQRLIGEVMDMLDSANGLPHAFDYLTGCQAESADTFKKSFEREMQLPFTPKHFRDHRLALLDRADAVVNIRVGMSESGAFELAYHIFKGRCTPVLFLVWKHAPIKTTLLRELQDLCEVTYLEFDQVDELRAGVHAFFHQIRP